MNAPRILQLHNKDNRLDRKRTDWLEQLTIYSLLHLGDLIVVYGLFP